MTDRERLIEILKLDSCPSPYICDESCKYANLKQCYEERTADLLLEHGVIVLPCKVGDTVYCYDEDLYAILDYRIEQIIFSGGFLTLYSGVCSNEDVLLSDIDFWETDLGKTVFLTREEAEKALKEQKK